MKGFVDYISEELKPQRVGIHHNNSRIANAWRGKLRNLIKNPIKASGSVDMLSKYTDHKPLLKDLEHAEKNYPESNVVPIIKAHIKRLKIPHMGV